MARGLEGPKGSFRLHFVAVAHLSFSDENDAILLLPVVVPMDMYMAKRWSFRCPLGIAPLETCNLNVV